MIKRWFMVLALVCHPALGDDEQLVQYIQTTSQTKPERSGALYGYMQAYGAKCGAAPPLQKLREFERSKVYGALVEWGKERPIGFMAVNQMLQEGDQTIKCEGGR